MLKSTVSQRVERTNTKVVSQRVEVDATPPSPVGSVLVKTSPDVTLGEDHVAKVDAEQVEDIDQNVELFAAIGTKVKPRSWVKKHESQACNRDKLKLKAVVLHDGRKEVHMLSLTGSLLQIQVQVLELDGAHLNELRLA